MLKKSFVAPLLFFIGVLSFGWHESAAQVCGGNITYQLLNPDSVEVRVDVFKLCGSQPPNDDSILVTSRDSSGIVQKKFGPYLIQSDSNIISRCSTACNSCTTSSCNLLKIIKISRYYHVSLRDSVFTNYCKIQIRYFAGSRALKSEYIKNADNTETYLGAEFNRCLVKTSQSPDFAYNPIFLAPIGKDFFQCNGVFDPDFKSNGQSDSLHIELSKPSISPNAYVIYELGFDSVNALYYYNYPLAKSEFPKGISMNPQSGNLRFRPMKSGISYLKFRIYEFRNHQKIGYVEREQMLIVDTFSNSMSIPSGSSLSSYYNEENFRLSICEGDSLSLKIGAHSLKNDTVRISVFQPDSTWRITHIHPGLSDTIQIVIPGDTSYIRQQPLRVTVETSSLSCPYQSKSSATFLVQNVGKPKSKVSAQYSIDRKILLNSEKINNRITTGLEWKFDGKFFNNAIVITDVKKPGIYSFRHITKGVSGCNDTLYGIVTTPKFPYVRIKQNDTALCEGEVLKLEAEVLGDTTNSYELKWNTGSIGQVNHISVEKDTLIIVKITLKNGFTNFDSIRIKVLQRPAIEIVHPSVHCENNPLVLRYQIISADVDSFMSFEWRNTATQKILGAGNSITIRDSAQVELRAQSANGCISFTKKKFSYTKKITSPEKLYYYCLHDRGSIVMYNGPNKWYEWRDKKRVFPEKGDSLSFLANGSKQINVTVFDTTQKASCRWKDSFIVVLKKQPVVTILSQPEICAASILYNLDDPGFTQPQGGYWYGLNNIEKAIVGKHFFNPQTAADGIHQVHKVYTDPISGCTRDTFAKIKVNALPRIFLRDTLKLCVGSPLQLLQATPAGGTWTGKGVKDSGLLYYFNPEDVQIGENNTVTYTLTDTNNCTQIDSQLINIGLKVNPNASITYGKVPITIEFKEIRDTLDCKVNKWKWYFGDKNHSYSNNQVARFTYTKSGIYTISLVVEDTISGVRDSGWKENYIRLLPASITEDEFSNWLIKPNPAHDYLQLLSLIDNVPFPVFYKIVNSTGQVVVENRKLTGQMIPLDGISTGLYYLVLSGNEQAYKPMRFLKQ